MGPPKPWPRPERRGPQREPDLADKYPGQDTRLLRVDLTEPDPVQPGIWSKVWTWLSGFFCLHHAVKSYRHVLLEMPPAYSAIADDDKPIGFISTRSSTIEVTEAEAKRIKALWTLPPGMKLEAGPALREVSIVPAAPTTEDIIE